MCENHTQLKGPILAANSYMNLQAEHMVAQLALTIELLETCKVTLENDASWTGPSCDVQEATKARVMSSLSLASSNVDALLRAEHMP